MASSLGARGCLAPSGNPSPFQSGDLKGTNRQRFRRWLGPATPGPALRARPHPSPPPLAGNPLPFLPLGPSTLSPLPVPLPPRVREASLRPVPPSSSRSVSSVQTPTPARPAQAPPSARPRPSVSPPQPGPPGPAIPFPRPRPPSPETSPRPWPRLPEVSWAPGGQRDRAQRAAARPGVDGTGGARAAPGVSGGAADRPDLSGLGMEEEVRAGQRGGLGWGPPATHGSWGSGLRPLFLPAPLSQVSRHQHITPSHPPQAKPRRGRE